MNHFFIYFLAIPFAVIAQELASDNFEAHSIGNVSEDISGATAGESGYLVYSSNGSGNTTNMDASTAQIVNYNNSNALQLTGPNGEGGICYVWKDGVSDLWASRTPGNDIIIASVNFVIPTNNPDSHNTFYMVIYYYDDTSVKSLAGLYINTNQATDSTSPSWIVRPYMYFDGTANGGQITNYLIDLNPEASCQAGVVHQLTISYNKTDGMTRYQFDGGEIIEVQGAAAGSDVKELDFITATVNTSTGATVAYYDNVSCVATNSLLGVEDVGLRASVSTVSPNPVRDFLNINLASKYNPAYTQIQIIDVNGREILSTSYSESINMESLPEGVYMLSISDGKNSENQKFIKR